MGFEGTLIYLGHRQDGSLAKPLIAWPLQPSGCHAIKAGYPTAPEGELLD